MAARLGLVTRNSDIQNPIANVVFALDTVQVSLIKDRFETQPFRGSAVSRLSRFPKRGRFLNSTVS